MGILDGKIAIVTGSGHGIGRGEALELSAQGAKVVINDLGGSAMAARVDRQASLGRRERSRVSPPPAAGEAVATPTTTWPTSAGPRILIATAYDTFLGGLDILVNNAAASSGTR